MHFRDAWTECCRVLELSAVLYIWTIYYATLRPLATMYNITGNCSRLFYAGKASLWANPKSVWTKWRYANIPGSQQARESKETWNGQLYSRTPSVCPAAHHSVVSKFVDMLTSPPILVYPDFDLPFVLHTDASNNGLELKRNEKNCRLHSGKLEFLALKWAICDKFRDYL